VVQDLVLNGVVERYRDWIRVGKLDAVVGFDAGEQDELVRVHQRCSDVVDGHDPTSARNAPVPDAKNPDSNLQSLKALIAAIRARRAKGKAAPTTGVVQVRRNLWSQCREAVMSLRERRAAYPRFSVQGTW